METEAQTTSLKERAKCQLCGLEQMVEEMAIDRQGRKYCPGLVACWARWEEQNGIERSVK